MEPLGLRHPRTLLPTRTFFVELDVLRGMAAILMIVNHAGGALLSPVDASSSASGFAVSLGSFAPVLFFFATGLGIGIGAGAGRRSGIGSATWKASLLIVADQFFFWAGGKPYGLDFFGFIGLATIVVTLIARGRRPVATTMLSIGLLVGARYAVGPHLPAQFSGNLFVEWLVGVRAIDRVSYPASPWLVYPLLGFLAGRVHRPATGDAWAPRSGRWRGALSATGALFAFALLLSLLNSVFFRWGTVSFAYFVLSLAVLGACVLLSIYLTRAHPLIADRMSLRGVASFAVIPIHYALLHLLTVVVGRALPVGPWGFIALAVLVTLASIVLATLFAAALPLGAVPGGLLPSLLMAVLIAASLTVVASQRQPTIVPFSLLAGQLLVAAMLGLRSPRRRG